MKDLTNTSNELVAQIFADYHQSVFFYIYKKIGKKKMRKIWFRTHIFAFWNAVLCCVPTL